MNNKKHPLFIAALACPLLALATLTFGITLSQPTLATLGAENGSIENLAAAVFGLATLLGGLAWARTRATGWLVFTGLLLAATLRELDWHAKWTTMSILKLRFYSSAEVMGAEKAIGAVIILLLIIAVLYALRRVPASLKTLWAGDWRVTLIYAALGFLLVAKELDALFRLLPSLAPLRPEYGDLFRFCEEMFEVFAATCLAAAAAMRIKFNRT